jgi:hypothetical protein
MKRDIHKFHSSPKRRQAKSGQIVAEYLMILLFVCALLATTKIRIDTLGNIVVEETPDSKTILEHLSDSFSIWFQDILIIVSLPT